MTTNTAALKHRRVILEPIITMKSALLTQRQCYTFLVSADCNKYQIAQEITRLFGVKVLRVNTTVVRSKNKRTKKGIKRAADQKKAYVYTDAKISLFPEL